MTQEKAWEEVLSHLEQDKFLSLSCSSPREKSEAQLIRCKPVRIRGEVLIQVERFVGKQAFQKNLSPGDFMAWLPEALGQYRQLVFKFKDSTWNLLVNKAGAVHLGRSSTSSQTATTALTLDHNRQKKHLIPDGIPVPFLVALGVMSPEGRVRKEHQDKFRQINRFLEYIADILPQLPAQGTIHALDFGCGKAYLSFALYHYLVEICGRALVLTGLDLKESVVDFCNTLAGSLKYTGLVFKTGDIADYRNLEDSNEASQPTDLLITLHACDTATDLALAEGIARKASVILSVPCCQHELLHQMDAPGLEVMTKHGLIKERFAALATDAIRAELAWLCGYDVSVVEFIDPEHTPKNLMLRLVRRTQEAKEDRTARQARYESFRDLLGARPALEQALIARDVIRAEQLFQ